MCDDEEESTFESTQDEMECVCTPKEKAKKESLEFNTCPYDPRFPNTNQTRRCYVNFIDYQRCTRLLGNYQGCRIFKICYQSLCPNDWITRWTEQMENGTFACIYPPKQEGMELPDETVPFDTTGY